MNPPGARRITTAFALALGLVLLVGAVASLRQSTALFLTSVVMLLVWAAGVAISRSYGLATQERLAAAVRASEERFRQMAEHIHEVFWVCSADGNTIEYISPAYELIWGRTCESLRESPHQWLEAIDSRDQDRVAAAFFGPGLQEGFSEEYRIVRPDGTTRWIHDRGFPVRDEQGRVVRLVGLAEDITQRIETEEALRLLNTQLEQRVEERTEAVRRAEAQYRAIFENAQEGIYRTSPEGQFLIMNLALARIYGYATTAEAMAAITDIQSQLYVDPSRRLEFRRCLMSEGAVRDFQSEVRRKDGSAIWITENGHTVYDDHGQVVCFEGIVEDITERRRAEEALRESRQHYTNLVNAIEGIVWEVEARTFQFTFVSRQAERLLGYPVDQWISEPDFWARHIHDEDREWALGLCRQATEELRDHSFEYRMVAADGRVVWLHDLVTVIAEDGVAVRLQGVMVDITRRRLAETALSESRARLEEAQALARLGSWEYDPGCQTVTWSREMFRLFQRDPEQGVPPIEEVLELILPEDRALAAESRRRAFQEGQPVSVDYRICSNGEIRHIHATAHPVFDAEGRLMRLNGTCQDITARKQAEEELLRQHEELADFFENATEGLHWVAEDGTIVWANRAELEMMGYPREEYVGRHIGEFYVDAHVIENIMQRLAHDEPVHGYEARLRCRDGGIRHVLIDTTVRRDNGVFVHTRWFTRDITERRLAEEELRSTNRRLEQALQALRFAQARTIEQERLRALGQMASGIAHDFNNALSPILGYSELLLLQPKSLEDRALLLGRLKSIHTAAVDAAHVVTRLREFYRGREAADVFLPLNVSAIAEQAVSLTQPKWKNQAEAQGRRIEIVRELSEVLPVLGSESELRTALTNLIFNAIDAMPNGGTLTVRTGMRTLYGTEEGLTRATTDDREPLRVEVVVIEINDTGIGMEEETRQRCLDPFFTTKGDRGTGLGLGMVFGIVQRHEGLLEIETVPGAGTRVRIQLPAQLVEPAAAAIPSPDRVRPLRVLVVDDEPQVRNVLAEFLAVHGHHADLAENGLLGMEMFKAHRYDLVITDRAMPEMGGDELAGLIKQISPNKPIIMVTGFGDLMRDNDELPRGVDCILSKPLSLAALRDALVRVTREAV